MKKRWTALVLTLSMVCALALPAHAAEKVYPDTTGHYAADAISAWSEYGVLEGYLDGSFRPDGKITRAEMATVLNRVMGYQNKAENTFTDLPQGQWYTDYLLRAAAEGVFKGNPDGTMKPNEPITRQEAFAALSRVLNMAESEKATGFKDDASIADWARGYVSAMKQAGYIQGDQKGNIRAGDPITRAEVVTILNKMARGFVNADGTYSKDCKGNLIINAQDVTLKDMTVEGNLIVADGVGDGDVYLDKVTVKGDIVLRGCGENSFHILPGTKVKNIIVTKTTKGMIRLVNESGETIPMIFVNDGKAGVTLDGDDLGDVVIACDAKVTISAKSVKTVAINKDAKVTIAKGTTVAKVDLAKTATKASLTVEGKVTAMTNDAKIKVEKPNGGTVGSSSSSGSSSSGGSSSGGGSDTPAPSTPTTVSEVTLQLLAPAFGNIPDEADVLGVGYTAETKWLNADGSAPTYRWKAADSTEKDTFTADQAYQAVVTLSPVTGYAFAEALKVKVTDGKNPATEYTPAKSEKSGNNWIVTMEYEATEHKEPIEFAGREDPIEVTSGETEEIQVSMFDNYLVDSSTYSYQWYKCDEDGSNAEAIPGADKYSYTLSENDTMYTGMQYYFLKVTVMGKDYQSAVQEVVIVSSIDESEIPIPKIERVWISEDFRTLYYEVSNLIDHKDVRYDPDWSIYTEDGGRLETGGQIGDITDGHATGEIPLYDNDMICNHGIITAAELSSVHWTLATQILQGNTYVSLDDKCLSYSYDLTKDRIRYNVVLEGEPTLPGMEDRLTAADGIQIVVTSMDDYRSTIGTLLYTNGENEQPLPETYRQVCCVETSTNTYPAGEVSTWTRDFRKVDAHWVDEMIYIPELYGVEDENWDYKVWFTAVHPAETEEEYNVVYFYQVTPEIVINIDNQ